MCMADTSTMPSLTPLFFTIASTCGVMWMYSRCLRVWNFRYSVCTFIECSAEADRINHKGYEGSKFLHVTSCPLCLKLSMRQPSPVQHRKAETRRSLL